MTSTHNQASFAFLLARAMASERHADLDLDLDRPRAALAADPVFGPLFTEAKDAVRAMTLRFVEIDDPVLRTLFEVYAAIALGTRHNDFDTH